jgi:hypothetical protein
VVASAEPAVGAGGRFLGKDVRTCGSAHFVLKVATDAATAQAICFAQTTPRKGLPFVSDRQGGWQDREAIT